HDYNFKVKAVREFLAEGNKARITVMFRGREITHREIGQAILTRIGNELKEIAVIEQTPRLEGRLLFMILAPNPRWVAQMRAQHGKRKRPQQPRAAPAAAHNPAPPPPHPQQRPASQGAAAPAAQPAPAHAEAPKA